MATSRTKTGSPLQSTRQMLDELDTLMERMLALPVGDIEELPPLPRDVPITPTVKATLTSVPAVDEEPATHEERMPAESEQQFSGSKIDSLLSEAGTAPRPAPPPKPAPLRRHNASAVAKPHFVQTAPEPPEPPVEEDELPPPPAVVRPARAPRRLIAESAPASTASFTQLPLLPLLWVNQIFDACSLLLGPIGRGMRGERGRSVLGAVGLICLGLAGAWLAFDHLSGR